MLRNTLHNNLIDEIQMYVNSIFDIYQVENLFLF